MLRKDLRGKKFGKWLVLQEYSTTRNRNIKYLCQCECGTITNVLSSHLIQGNSKSCGCSILRGKDRKDWKGYEGFSGQFLYKLQKNANGTKGRRKLSFTVTPPYLCNLSLQQNRKCVLSGLSIFPDPKWDTKGNLSLDRINSSLGYDLGNIQWVHKDINKMKNSFNQDYFIKLCNLITNNAS